MQADIRNDAEHIVRSGIEAVLPEAAVLKALRRHPAPANVTLIAIGKAAWRMASAAYGELGSAVRQGLVITKYGHSMGAVGPLEIIEAGQMDGAGTMRTFVHVVLPVCRPILGAAAALSFADCWNLVEQPLVYLTDTNLQPLSVMFNQMNEQSTAVAFAGAALYLLPMLLVYLYFQDDILLGVQLSELK